MYTALPSLVYLLNNKKILELNNELTQLLKFFLKDDLQVLLTVSCAIAIDMFNLKISRGCFLISLYIFGKR